MSVQESFQPQNTFPLKKRRGVNGYKGLRSFISEYKIALAVFILYFIHGAFLGLSDDEAYYWVLGKKPALSYAFHPPAVGWMVWLSDKALGWMFHGPSEVVVRFPAAVVSALLIGMALRWLRLIGLHAGLRLRAACVLLSFFGFFALSWMMVPDIPLFLGWMILFVCTWNVCFRETRLGSFIGLALGAALILLSKYSGVLAVFSAAVCILVWAPKKNKIKGWSALGLGALCAALPILLWNYHHEWGSILYQIRDRHDHHSISWMRYLRFWIVEMVLVGPIALGIGIALLMKQGRKEFAELKLDRSLASPPVYSFLFVWVLPAALVFCTQPLYSDFKLHWAFVVWWPLMLGLAYAVGTPAWRWLKIQSIYGLSVGAIILVCCHFPLGSWVMQMVRGGDLDPRWDVTNDFYGWSDLRDFLVRELGEDVKKYAVIGSRYQTAAQASFYLRPQFEVTLLPRDQKEREEWPSLGVSVGEGPEWPNLTRPVLFVSDNRYNEPPLFPGAKCEEWKRLETRRFGFVAKTIIVWKCGK